HKGRAMINSITAEKSRYEKILPLCKDYDCLLTALTLDEKGMPETAQDRFELATIIMEICERYGVPKDRIYFDPLVRPISAEQKQAKEFLGAIKLIKELGLKTIAGLSNISFGLPKRQLLNKTFLPMAHSNGLDACIVDPLDISLMRTIMTSSTILGEDEYCKGYLKAYRQGKLGSGL
ncbi:MAG: dihydropteroate synthase, partial [Candidatus Omnitrophica bacterium]|nr:dihydropteroate synthase [Candidatus Omnitrophota bacterium]